MSKFKFCLIDDESSKVTRFKNYFSENFYDIEHIKSLIEFKSHIHQVGSDFYDAIVLDIQFCDGDSDSFYVLSKEDIVGIRRSLPKNVKIFIYTAYGPDHIDLLKDLVFPKTIDGWIDLSHLSSEFGATTVLKIEQIMGFHKESADGLWVLHLSDLHFGKQYKYASEYVGLHLSDLISNVFIENVDQNENIPIKFPDYLVLSGDFTNTCTKDQFEESLIFVEKLKKTLTNHSSKKISFIIAPGNHDFCWRSSIPSAYAIHEDDKGNRSLIENDSKDPQLKEGKFKNFIDHYSNYLGDPCPDCKEYAWSYDHSGRNNVRFYSYNTSYNLTFKNEIDRILVTRKCLENSLMITSNAKESLGIVVAHHPLDKWGDENHVKDLKNYLHNNLNVKLVFSGHKHSNEIKVHRLNDNKRLLEIQTGSSSASQEARGDENLPTFRILHIEKNDKNEWSKLNSWMFKYANSIYRPSPVGGKGDFLEHEEF